ncbi:hypothetical protein Hanom_Chr16g01450571 [Helianthus anomalus]
MLSIPKDHLNGFINLYPYCSPYPPSPQQPITALSTRFAMARNDSVAGYSEKWATLEAILTHGRRNKHHMVCPLQTTLHI